MKRVLCVICLVTLCFSALSALAADKVVVIPLTSSSGAIKVYDNNRQYLGILIGSDEYIKIFNPTLELTIALSKVNGSLLAPNLTWYYTSCSSDQAFGYRGTPEYAGLLLKNTFDDPDTFFSLKIPGAYHELFKVRNNNGTAACTNLWVEGNYFEIVEYSASEIQLTFPVAWPLQYR